MDTTPRRHSLLTRAATVTAAAAVGAGVAVGVYAATDHSSSASAPAIVATAAQPAAATKTASTITDVYRKAGSGVVEITVSMASGSGSSQSDSPFGTPSGGTQQAQGSGFVLDSAGHIITNYHVVNGADSISVRFANGKTAKATLVGKDASTDVAVLKVDVPSSSLNPLPLGDSSGVEVGQTVVAIGSPFGLEGSVTAGIVSAVGRTIDSPNGYPIAGAIQTDAAINHGNSGGALLDVNGQVIGITSQIESSSDGNEGVGFAIPIATAKHVADQLIAGGTVDHAYLGVRLSDSTSPAGARIGAVQPSTPAAKAGLQTGDVVTALDGTPVGSSDDLAAAIASKSSGDHVTLTIVRDGTTKQIDVTLGTRPS